MNISVQMLLASHRLVKICLVLTLLIPSHSLVRAQTMDSLQVKLGSGVVLSNKTDFLPHYLVSNSWGLVQEDHSFFLEGELDYSRKVWKELSFTTGFAFRNDLLAAHYVQLGYREFSLSLGRKRRMIGGLNNDLSSGSMAQSNNARPIPNIEFLISEFINVPFTKGYFKAKGHLNHGWLEDDRYMSNAQLHSKSFYLMLDLRKEIGFSAASGLVHFAQFGGISPQGEVQPASFSDYLRVFRGAGIPNPDGTTVGESNGLGNHLGIVETTVTKEIGEHRLTLNYQKPFEDEGSMQYISLTDYLLGMEWELPERWNFFRKVYVEYIQTKWQSGPGIPDPNDDILTITDNFGYRFGGRDNLYNNWLFKDGWTYNGLVIGNPLFLTHERTFNFFGTQPLYDNAVSNNRIRAIHAGFEGVTSGGVKLRGLFTYTSNFGTYSGLYQGRFRWNGAALDQDFEYVFRPAQDQFYFLIELGKDEILKKKPWGVRVRLALDQGDLYNAVGMEMSVSYLLMKN